MTTLGRHAVTSPRRFGLPADLVAQLERQAGAEGIDVEELVARVLVDILPLIVAEKTEGWLRTTLSLAYPVEVAVAVPAICEGRPEDVHTDIEAVA